MPIYEAPSVAAKISSTPFLDPKKQQQDAGLKLFQADVPYHQEAQNAAKQAPEANWGIFKNRDHLVSMHFS